eukprot:PLAT6051.2.p1 GENE.PLAT6051.2~~PLAT6051.2.p1  ORF type:complete len:130 (-),score=60.08 PLAT6051.2:179-568(-)
MSADEAALRSIDGALAELHQLLVLVEDWNDDSQPLLDSKLNAFVSRLGELRGCSFSEKLLVPPALLAVMDREDDNNPELYARDLVGECLAESGRLDLKFGALETLRDRVASGATALAADVGEESKSEEV